ncbi:WD repeat domain phosphoinositide-interacting protein 2 isoform X2 [Lucilia cuprina]|uniref:WD repeat domain phosphoinositide-interacting protein 2 isoform X2 n=1 Tax=Lucilia cuprina TaxID=7375 RepID=UPI001F0576F9|nr:WD repeat domain phosphoinositide-interacting protein 2 isoform X2 [Lucilia cuprina]
MSSTMAEGYIMNFNQDFTSISVLSKNGFRLFTINAGDKIDEIFAKENSEQIRIVERLFNSSLVVLVTQQKPNCLKMLHFKKKQDICNCVYPSDILCVRMNRYRLIVCLAESIHIHDIRDMKILHSIENIAPNEYGLCSLSLNSHLAFPICTTSGELRIFNANKLKTGLTIKAHDTALSALNFSPNGTMLATASERGTVIRVFCVKNGQRVQEFRRGVKRCVRIASLVFSTTGDFLCASSNTETVHIFKIDVKAVEAAERKSNIDDETKKPHTALAPSTSQPKEEASNNQQATKASANSTTSADAPVTANSSSSNQTPASTTSNNSWSMSGYLSKAVSSYLIPSQIGDVLAQDRAFATAVLGQPGLKHVCGLARIQKELRLLMACEDGFLYVYDFNSEKGGPCKLLHVHDLRYTLEGVIELNLTDSMDKISLSGLLPSTPTTNPSSGFSADKTPTISTDSQHSKDSSPSPHSKSSSMSSVSVIIENPEPTTDNSYASILKGSEQTVNTTLTADSAKFRKLCDAIDTPTKLYDERQFPPVAIAAKD